MRYQHGSITFNGNSKLIHYLLREFTFDQLSLTRIHNLFYTESLWIHYQVNSLQIHYDFRKFTINSLSVLRIPFVLGNSKNSQPREFHTHQLSFPRIPNRYSIIFPYSLWIHYQLHALTIDQLCFENWELIHLFRELTMNLLLFSQFTMHPWSFPPIHY